MILKKLSSKVLSAILVMCMILLVVPVSAKAATSDYITVEAGDSDILNLSWSGTTGTLTSSGSFMPDQFTLWVEGTSSVTSSTGLTLKSTEVVTAGGDTNTGYYFTNSGTTPGTITVTVSASHHSNTGTYTINVPAPSTSIPSGAHPTAVVSYLPIGQYATGAAWGTASGKFVSGTGYASTGVSLGALGGYIEYDFGANNGISENAKNPYGVDLVVYGNAFNGNPEAGAVQVSENGTTWYELAGSLYYDGNFNYVGNQASNTNKFSNAYTGVLRNADVIYTLKNDKINVSLKDANGTAKISNEKFTTARAWWPTTSEYANSVITNAHKDSNVTIARSGDTNGSTLAYGGITAIPDSNTTSYYAFGYCDVTPNGSPSAYGDAINPYTPYTTSKKGGDGFDLSWAVDVNTGIPVNVTGKVFRYVRVYSAVLDNGDFNETSAEVCGIFATANVASTSVGTTSTPTIKINNTSIADYVQSQVSSSIKGNVIYYDATNLNLSSGSVDVTTSNSQNIYVNSTYGTTSASESISGGKMIRIIVQDGNKAPYIAVIKF